MGKKAEKTNLWTPHPKPWPQSPVPAATYSSHRTPPSPAPVCEAYPDLRLHRAGRGSNLAMPACYWVYPRGGGWLLWCLLECFVRVHEPRFSKWNGLCNCIPGCKDWCMLSVKLLAVSADRSGTWFVGLMGSDDSFFV